MPRQLLRSSAARRTLSPGRGPMVPKAGSIASFEAAYATMCSASSVLPIPAADSKTTTPPSENGLFAGALSTGGPVGMSCSPWWMFFSNVPPSICCTRTMPSQVFTLQSRCTLSCCMLLCLLLFLPAKAPPPKGASYQGKRILKWVFFSCDGGGVGNIPICTEASFLTGSNTGIQFPLPLTLMGARALKMSSVLDLFFVAPSQRMLCGFALDISRAERLTTSPSTVYSILRALPQTPQ
mmetsp:Transcript_127172/g.356144  ORF Transcript_127172/g.356144 Transcript_127172/m.356144 type:complete len:238 (-) Transcript_127172:621-1334(-)